MIFLLTKSLGFALESVISASFGTCISFTTGTTIITAGLDLCERHTQIVAVQILKIEGIYTPERGKIEQGEKRHETERGREGWRRRDRKIFDFIGRRSEDD